ncbi:MAG: crotonase/enoyl-CoA hydratase family protein [Solirubrobacterales bacterium]
MNSQSSVLTERRDDVLVVTIDRPRARNAVDLSVALGIEAAMEELDADDSLRVGILTGSEGYFCAGMDLKAFAAGEKPFTDRGFGGLVEKPPRKVLIAAVEGFALAGGLELALACDLIVAARGVDLAITEVRRGLVAAGGGLLRLPRRLPHNLAMEMAVTGAPIGAERGYELGFVNRLCEPGEALDQALELAAMIAPNAPLAVDLSKAILADQREWSNAEGWERQTALTDPIFKSADAHEGAVAFAEKRPPVWRGC